MIKMHKIDINRLLEKIRMHPDSHKMGMIASHLGIVRGSSRDNREVIGVDVAYDLKAIDDIIKEIKKLPGIVEVLVDINEGSLEVGDEILFVAVGGDIRDNVFDALIKAVDLIKKRASHKREMFIDQRGGRVK
jgi:molybdopterin synthase catalytic subunit